MWLYMFLGSSQESEDSVMTYGGGMGGMSGMSGMSGIYF